MAMGGGDTVFLHTLAAMRFFLRTLLPAALLAGLIPATPASPALAASGPRPLTIPQPPQCNANATYCPYNPVHNFGTPITQDLAGGSFPWAGATSGDVYADGNIEIVVGFPNGYLYVFDSALNVEPGWPQYVGGAITATPTLADLDGSGRLEILAGSSNGTLNVYRPDGSVFPGWPFHSPYPHSTYLNNGDFHGGIAVADLRGDGQQEVIAGSYDHHLYVFTAGGQQLWNRDLWDTIWDAPTITHLQNAQTRDIVIGSDCLHTGTEPCSPNGGTYWAYDPSGNLLWSRGLDETPWSTSASADLNHDGSTEVTFGSGFYYPNGSACFTNACGKWVETVNSGGGQYSGWPAVWTGNGSQPGSNTCGRTFGAPAIGDLLNNGTSVVVDGAADSCGHIYGWSANGSLSWLANWPGTDQSSPTIGPMGASGNGVWITDGNSLDGFTGSQSHYFSDSLGGPAVAAPLIVRLGGPATPYGDYVIATSRGDNNDNWWKVSMYQTSYDGGGTDTTLPITGQYWPQFHGTNHGTGYIEPLAPGRPRGVVASTPSAGQVALSWSEPYDSGTSAVDGYRVLAYTANGTLVSGYPLTVSGTSTTLTAASDHLSNGTPYIFTVEAANSVGPGAQSLASNSATPFSAANAPSAASQVVSTHQYVLPNSDGGTWQEMDESSLAFTDTAPANGTMVLSANADLWTWNSGYNQDIGICVLGGTYSGGSGPNGCQVVGWKESGGFAGTFSPNAAFVEAPITVTNATAYDVRVVWKANKSALGATISAAAGNSPTFSPTRLTAEFFPGSSFTVTDKVSPATSQYKLTGSDGAAWHVMDATNLATSFSPSSSGDAVIDANADLWTWTARYNQDLGICLVAGSSLPDPCPAANVVAWKESGGFAGTFSPNAAFVQTVQPVTSGVTYHVGLVWKTNINASSSGASISAGAGTSPNFSPTRLTITLPLAVDHVRSTVITSQEVLSGSDGTTWTPMNDEASLQQTVSAPASGCVVVITANTDLWTANTGINQDIGIMVDGSLAGWKESGGFGGTLSPNAAYLQFVLPAGSWASGASHTVQLYWKANKAGTPSTSNIYAGAGSGPYSPTRLTTLFEGC